MNLYGSKAKQSFLVIGFLLAQFIFATFSFAEILPTNATALENLKSVIISLNKQNAVDIGSLFTENLAPGDRSTNVLLLQKVLNLHSDTIVALTGYGSVGSETDFYGPATVKAVTKFQEKYGAEILYPIGLSRGTGRVASYTRMKLNSVTRELLASNKIANSKNPVTPVPTRTSPPVSGKVPTPTPTTAESLVSTIPSDFFDGVTEPIIAYVSSYDGSPGAKIIITAGGLSPTDNIVHFGEATAVSDTKVLGSSLTFVVPNIPVGKYDLFITNKRGTSNKKFFVVTDPLSSPPSISSFLPKAGLYGQEVVIQGSNFTSTGNEIYTSYGSIKEVASTDGKTLTFKVLPFPEIPELRVGVDLKQGIRLPIGFYVINNNGVSRTSGLFVLEI